eukprot:scaffold11299_cov40-Phaeocystis_antarctica.AAC.4
MPGRSCARLHCRTPCAAASHSLWPRFAGWRVAGGRALARPRRLAAHPRWQARACLARVSPPAAAHAAGYPPSASAAG